jgi:hypothetical protein
VERCFAGHNEFEFDAAAEAKAEEAFADRMLDDPALFGRKDGKLKDKVSSLSLICVGSIFNVRWARIQYN